MSDGDGPVQAVEAVSPAGEDEVGERTGGSAHADTVGEDIQQLQEDKPAGAAGADDVAVEENVMGAADSDSLQQQDKHAGAGGAVDEVDNEAMFNALLQALKPDHTASSVQKLISNDELAAWLQRQKDAFVALAPNRGALHAGGRGVDGFGALTHQHAHQHQQVKNANRNLSVARSRERLLRFQPTTSQMSFTRSGTRGIVSSSNNTTSGESQKMELQRLGRF